MHDRRRSVSLVKPMWSTPNNNDYTKSGKNEYEGDRHRIVVFRAISTDRYAQSTIGARVGLR